MCIILGQYFQPIFDLFFPPFVAGIQGTTLQIGDDASIEKTGHKGRAEECGNLPRPSRGFIRFFVLLNSESTKKVCLKMRERPSNPY